MKMAVLRDDEMIADREGTARRALVPPPRTRARRGSMIEREELMAKAAAWMQARGGGRPNRARTRCPSRETCERSVMEGTTEQHDQVSRRRCHALG